jgi:alpha-1,2-mannosyltransferase
MLLGQLTAISVSTGLFVVALSLHPRIITSPRLAPPRLWLPLLIAFVTIYFTPTFVGSPRFLNNILWMHALLIAPLLTREDAAQDTTKRSTFDIPFRTLYTVLAAISALIHVPNTLRLLESLPRGKTLSTQLFNHMFEHPAQSSFSFDTVFTAITLALWYVTSGSILATIGKTFVAGAVGIYGITRYTGINWGLMASLLPIGALLCGGTIMIGLQRLRSTNEKRKKALFTQLGLSAEVAAEGKPSAAKATRKGASSSDTKMIDTAGAEARTIVGFWHPFWYVPDELLTGGVLMY